MQMKISSEINWDGSVLSGKASVESNSRVITITRDMIHTLPMYNDAVGWEIERFKDDIFQRLAPAAIHLA